MDNKKFFLYFDTGNDVFNEPFEIEANKDLFVGDLIDVSDNDILKTKEEEFNTCLFRIIKRQYNVEYKEMFLHLEPFHV